VNAPFLSPILLMLLACPVKQADVARARRIDGVDTIPLLQALRVLAEPTERPEHRLVEVASGWSVYDYRDSLVVTAAIERVGRSGGRSGAVLAAIDFRAGTRVWTDSSKETVDPDVTDSTAVWLPASITIVADLSSLSEAAGDPVFLRLGAIYPDQVLRSLRQRDPELSITALRIRAVLLAPGRTAGAPGPILERIVPLTMGD